MKPTTAVLLGAAGGIAVGFVLASYLVNSSSCCNVVAAGVRDKAASLGGSLGAGAVAFGDATGLWKPLAGIVSVLGVTP